MYLDGESVTTVGQTKQLVAALVPTLKIGTPEDDLTALIDDVRIYNRALSPAEITRIYESYF